ncbi:unnamed protein product [Amoebophrya sp. A25]|nr:unnamed protein product [Amoebophrya sp. A25]|eukprot:GSA25T00007517001.1
MIFARKMLLLRRRLLLYNNLIGDTETRLILPTLERKFAQWHKCCKTERKCVCAATTHSRRRSIFAYRSI